MYLFVLKFNIIFFTRPFIALCIFLYASCFSVWCKSFVICISSKNKKIKWEWEREQQLEKNPYKIYCMYIKYFNDLLLLFPLCNAFHYTHTSTHSSIPPSCPWLEYYFSMHFGDGSNLLGFFSFGRYIRERMLLSTWIWIWELTFIRSFIIFVCISLYLILINTFYTY